MSTNDKEIFDNLENHFKARFEKEENELKQQSNLEPLPVKQKIINTDIPGMLLDYSPIKDNSAELAKDIETLPVVPKEKRAVLPLFEIGNLGSAGYTYPDNSRVFFHSYLETEIRNISLQVENMPLHYLFRLMLEGIHTVGFNKFDITFDDFLFISLNRRFRAFGLDDLIYPEKCPVCNRLNTYKYKYNQITTYDLLPENAKIKESFTFAYASEDPLNPTYETIELEFAPLTIGNFLKLGDLNLLTDVRANYAFLCTNRDPVELFNNEFQFLLPEHTEKLQQIENRFYHGFKLKTEPCQHKNLDIDKGDRQENTDNCEGVLTFDVNPNYSLVLPLRVLYTIS